MLPLPSAGSLPLYLLRYEQGADLSLHSNTPYGQYPPDWDDIATFIKWLANGRCEHCTHRHDRKTWHILTTHHINRIVSDNRYVNLVALCQRCHLYFQVTYRPDQEWLFDEFIPLWAKRRQITQNPTLPTHHPIENAAPEGKEYQGAGQGS